MGILNVWKINNQINIVVIDLWEIGNEEECRFNNSASVSIDDDTP